jgi:hypothetical protein
LLGNVCDRYISDVHKPSVGLSEYFRILIPGTLPFSREFRAPLEYVTVAVKRPRGLTEYPFGEASRNAHNMLWSEADLPCYLKALLQCFQ